MTRIEKLLDRVINNPNSVAFSDLNRLLLYYGFGVRTPKGGSSHYHYFHKDLDDIVTIPRHKPIKAIYVKKALKAISEVSNGK